MKCIDMCIGILTKHKLFISPLFSNFFLFHFSLDDEKRSFELENSSNLASWVYFLCNVKSRALHTSNKRYLLVCLTDTHATLLNQFEKNKSEGCKNKKTKMVLFASFQIDRWKNMQKNKGFVVCEIMNIYFLINN